MLNRDSSLNPKDVGAEDAEDGAVFAYRFIYTISGSSFGFVVVKSALEC